MSFILDCPWKTEVGYSYAILTRLLQAPQLTQPKNIDCEIFVSIGRTKIIDLEKEYWTDSLIYIVRELSLCLKFRKHLEAMNDSFIHMNAPCRLSVWDLWVCVYSSAPEPRKTLSSQSSCSRQLHAEQLKKHTQRRQLELRSVMKEAFRIPSYKYSWILV